MVGLGSEAVGELETDPPPPQDIITENIKIKKRYFISPLHKAPY
tara:strand:- start:1101 stop:1232 length:132 start_codon:yes stop_codon:yes gene_type:complete